MKKFSKIMLITAGAFAAVGLSFSTVGAVMGAAAGDVRLLRSVKEHISETDWDDDWDDDDWDDDDHEDSRHAGSVKSSEKDGIDAYETTVPEELEIDLKNGVLIMDTHEGTELLIEVEGDEKHSVEVKEGEKTVKIRKKETRPDTTTVTVYYPESTFFSKVDLELNAGKIEICSDLLAEELSIQTGAGEVINSGTIDVTECDLEVGAGSIELTGLSAREISGECGIGSLALEIDGEQSEFYYEIECGVGKIEIGDDSYSGMAGKKTAGNKNADRKMELECGIGDITVDFI